MGEDDRDSGALPFAGGAIVSGCGTARLLLGAKALGGENQKQIPRLRSRTACDRARDDGAVAVSRVEKRAPELFAAAIRITERMRVQP